MIAFIDDHRAAHGVEPICKVLPIAPSTYHAHASQRRDPEKLSPRAQRDRTLAKKIRRIHVENFGVYGARKVWRQLLREGESVARCTVERLMRRLGLRGAVPGKPVRTTISDKAAPCPQDKVNRQFHADRPNALWVADFTYVATWSGFVYVAFVVDGFARRIVGWRVSRSAPAGFVLDALEQALHERRPVHGGGLVHHSDRGSQYLSIKYTERLKDAGVKPSVGSVGDSYDNALAETVNGLYKAEVKRTAPATAAPSPSPFTKSSLSVSSHYSIIDGRLRRNPQAQNRRRQMSPAAPPMQMPVRTMPIITASQSRSFAALWVARPRIRPDTLNATAKTTQRSSFKRAIKATPLSKHLWLSAFFFLEALGKQSATVGVAL